MDGVSLNGIDTNSLNPEQVIPIGLTAYQGPLNVLIWLDAAAAAQYASGLNAGYYSVTLNDQQDGYWLRYYGDTDPAPNAVPSSANPSSSSDLAVSDQNEGSATGNDGGATGANTPNKTINLRDIADTTPRLLSPVHLDIPEITLDLSDPSAVIYTVTVQSTDASAVSFYGAEVLQALTSSAHGIYQFSHQDALDQNIYFAITDHLSLFLPRFSVSVSVNGNTPQGFNLLLASLGNETGSSGHDSKDFGTDFTNSVFYDAGQGHDNIKTFGGNAVDKSRRAKTSRYEISQTLVRLADNK